LTSDYGAEDDMEITSPPTRLLKSDWRNVCAMDMLCGTTDQSHRGNQVKLSRSKSEV